ncbi:hypothetical protein NL676_030279 [Syzygium grande]|nr:hypothetical protein NL676_030279 [Syzygium grande]
MVEEGLLFSLLEPLLPVNEGHLIFRRSFGKAFHLRKKRFDEKDIQEGQRALREVSDLHGWESEKVANGHEGELVEKVVEKILSNGPWDHDYEGVPKVLRQRKSPLWFHDLMRAPSSGVSNELLSEVRWLRWNYFQSDLSTSTTNLHLPKLSVLDLSSSDITEDWEGWWSLFTASKRLRVLHLGYCFNLRCTTPDLSAFAQLKILILTECIHLEHLHPSIGKLTSLVSLDLSLCERLKELPEEVGELKDLEELLLDFAPITEIPTSIGSLRKLEKLSARCCRSLREIPSSIGDLQNLQHLDLFFSGIEKLTGAVGRLKNLRTLILRYCYSLKGAIPSEIGDSSSLEILDFAGTPISDLPESIRNLSSLQRT